jgi:hypothetical protein
MRWTFVVALALPGALSVFACGESDAPLGATAEGGIPSAVLAEGAWGSSACAVCTFDKCKSELTNCRAEPGCARNLDCIEACPTNAEGDPEASCVSRCPIADASAAEGRRVALEQCRTTGRATSCPDCAASQRRRFRHPLLNSVCEDLPYDAGPDATAVQERCGLCLSKRCCDARNTCNADPSCGALRECVDVCNTDACIDACYVKYDPSIANLFALVTCAVVLCAPECESPDTPCNRCLYGDCADEVMACAADHTCKLLSFCADKCGPNELCQRACRDKYPAAGTLFSNQLGCVQNRCPGACL